MNSSDPPHRHIHPSQALFEELLREGIQVLIALIDEALQGCLIVLLLRAPLLLRVVQLLRGIGEHELPGECQRGPPHLECQPKRPTA